MITLGIETSCDETALALIETRGENLTFECRVIHSLVHSQAKLHSAYGGVYPNLAKREHSKNLIPLLKKLLHETGSISNFPPNLSNENWELKLTQIPPDLHNQNPELYQSLKEAYFLNNIPKIDRIAVTEGPGLEPALWVGIVFARILSSLWNVPIIPVNHMEGHVVGSLLQSDKPLGSWQKLKHIDFPALSLLISGGHTEIVEVSNMGNYKIIGQTKDDAVGEAFDKTARLLGLPYPGGPHVSRLAQEARELEIISPIKLPRPMIHSNDLDFSFSGLKTAVLYATRRAQQTETFDDNFKKGLCREFEEAVIETLNSKIILALQTKEIKALIIGGGVSANKQIIERLRRTAGEYSIPIFTPSQHLSGDNALMIALAGALSPKTKTPGDIRAHGTKKLV